MTPFYGCGSTTSRLVPLRGGSLLFATKFPETPGTSLSELSLRVRRFILLIQMKEMISITIAVENHGDE